MDASAQLSRRLGFGGWHIEMMLAAIALAIAILPSISFYRERTESRARINRLEQANRRAELATAHSAPALGPTARLCSLKASAKAGSLQLPLTPQWIVFSLDVEASNPFPFYTVTIRGADGREVWQADNLTTPEPGKLVFVLPSKVLREDYFTVFLKGQGNTGEVVPVVEYTFHAAT